MPCISTDCPCGGAKLLIEDGVSGLLTLVNDEVALCDAMKKIAESKAFADYLSSKALATREIYSEDNILSKYFNYIEKVINSSR